MVSGSGVKAYLATAFKNKAQFHELKSLLEAAGHTVTHDWTTEDETKVPEEQKPIYLMKCAMADVLGVCSADVLILIAKPNMAGALVEFGIAIASSIPVLVLDGFKEGNQKCIFYHFPQCGKFQHVQSYDDILKVLAAPPAKQMFKTIETSAGRN